MVDQFHVPEVNPELQRMVDALTPEYLRGNKNVVDPNAQPGKIPAIEPMNFAPFLTADLVGNAAGLGAKAAAPLAGKLSPYAAALALAPRRLASSGPVKGFNIVNDLGKVVGDTTIVQRSPKDLWIDYIGSDTAQANTLGLKEIRSLLPEIKKHYPEAERVGGWRGTGARTGPVAKKSESGKTGWESTAPIEGAEFWQKLR